MDACGNLSQDLYENVFYILNVLKCLKLYAASEINQFYKLGFKNQ